MNEPNKPAEGITPLENPQRTLPPFWWLNPWRAAIQQAKSSDIYRAWWLSTDKQLCKTAVDLAGEKLRSDVTNRNITDTANAAGFEASKAGYVINGQPCSPFPLNWLGEAVAYWKGEAYAARRERDDAKADKAEAEKHHAEEHAANVRLQQELAEVQSRLNAAIFAFKKPAKRKAKKKGGKR